MKRYSKLFAALVIGLVVVGGLGGGAGVALSAVCEGSTPYDCGDVCAADGTDDASQADLCDAAELAAIDAEAAADAETAAETAAEEAEAAAAAAAAASSTVVSTSTTTTSTSTTHVLSNPLGSTDLRVVIGYIIKALLGLSGAIALFVFVWSGIMMMLAAGSPEKIKTAKNSLTWATIGLVVIFTAYTLVYTLIMALSTGTTG